MVAMVMFMMALMVVVMVVMAVMAVMVLGLALGLMVMMVVPAMKSALTGPQNTPRGPQSAASATNSAHQDSRRAALPGRLAASKDNIEMSKQCLKTSHMSKSHGSLNLPRKQSTLKTTHSHHHVQSTAPATKSVHRHKATPICTFHEKSILNHQNKRFRLCPRTASQLAPAPAC